MRVIRHILTLIGAVVTVLAAAFYIYLLRHEMAPAASRQVGARGRSPAVIVATQGSAYKDALTQRLADHFRNSGTYVRIIDVSGLPAVVESEWDAFVVIHTWEKWKPEANARAFVERVQDRHKLVVLTTSGSGDERMPCVDAVTSASELARSTGDAVELARRVDRVLAVRQASMPR